MLEFAGKLGYQVTNNSTTVLCISDPTLPPPLIAGWCFLSSSVSHTQNGEIRKGAGATQSLLKNEKRYWPGAFETFFSVFVAKLPSLSRLLSPLS